MPSKGKTQPDCECCAIPTNRTTRILIKCPGQSCEYKACRLCHEKYFKQSGLKCMSCGLEYTAEHFDPMGLPKNWLKKYYIEKHLLEIAIQKNIQYLPNAQEEASKIQRIRDNEKKIRELIADGKYISIDSLYIIRAEYYTILRTVIYTAVDDAESIDDIDKFIKDPNNIHVFKNFNIQIRESYIEVDNRIQNEELKQVQDKVEELRRQNRQIKRTLDKKTRAVYNAIRKCVQPDCRGFIGDKWKCEMCETKICNKCHVPLDATPHVCDPEVVSTIAEIERTTRPCPKCGVRISKINGCDQMWCISCHATFSWQTGDLITSRNHNPHYYEWLRTVSASDAPPREIGDIPCGGIPDIRLLRHYFISYTKNGSKDRTTYAFYGRLGIEEYFENAKDSKLKLIIGYSAVMENIISNAIQTLEHVSALQTHNFRQGGHENQLHRLHVSYLLKDISEKVFQKEIAKVEFAEIKKDMYRPILNTYVQVGAEIMRKLTTAGIPEDISIEINPPENVNFTLIAAHLNLLLPVCEEYIRFHHYISKALHSIAKSLKVAYDGKICANLNEVFHKENPPKPHCRMTMMDYCGQLVEQFKEKFSSV